MATATFRIWRGEKGYGKFQDYTTEVAPGMVVLDSVHHIQAEQANDLAVRWNCKAGKCGSCSAEINGMPKLMCMTRLNSLPLDKPVTIEPMKAFPHVKDLVTELSWNYEVKKRIAKFNRAVQTLRTGPGAWRKRMSIASRSFENALSVIFARTFATCFVSTTCTTNSSGRVFWFMRRRWKCIHWTRQIAPPN